MVENTYLFLPESTLNATPEDLQLDYSDIQFRAVDGVMLHGWFIPGQDDMPVVFFCHGNAGNVSNRLRMIRLLHDLGLSTFIFDYRGYGNSQGKACETGMYNDARGALLWLGEQGWRPEQMIYLGRSLGAAVALQMALEQSPARLVMECPFTSIAEMGEFHYPRLYPLLSWFVAAQFDNLSKIHQLKSPLLICHGVEDAITPVAMGLQLFERARSPKRLLLVDGGGHSDVHIMDNQNYLDSWREFTDLTNAYADSFEDRETIPLLF